MVADSGAKPSYSVSERDIGAHTVCRNPHQPVFADARLYIPVSPCVDRCVPITDRRSGVLQVVIQPLLELSVRTQSLGEHRPVVRMPLPQMRFEREAPGQHVIQNHHYTQAAAKRLSFRGALRIRAFSYVMKRTLIALAAAGFAFAAGSSFAQAPAEPAATVEALQNR